MTTRQRWTVAYRNARLMAFQDVTHRLYEPAFDQAIEIAFQGYDPLTHKSSGLILGHLRRKQAVLARGGFWMGYGFSQATSPNCHCALVGAEL